MFKLHAPYAPKGDQPKAIEKLVDGINKGKKNQVRQEKHLHLQM